MILNKFKTLIKFTQNMSFLYFVSKIAIAKIWEHLLIHSHDTADRALTWKYWKQSTNDTPSLLPFYMSAQDRRGGRLNPGTSWAEWESLSLWHRLMLKIMLQTERWVQISLQVTMLLGSLSQYNNTPTHSHDTVDRALTQKYWKQSTGGAPSLLENLLSAVCVTL